MGAALRSLCFNNEGSNVDTYAHMCRNFNDNELHVLLLTIKYSPIYYQG